MKPSMPDEIEIARTVQRLRREGENFSSTYRKLQQMYPGDKIPFSFADYERYLGMQLSPEQAPVSESAMPYEQHPTLTALRGPSDTPSYAYPPPEISVHTEGAKHPTHGITINWGLIGSLGMLAIAGLLFYNSLGPKEKPLTQDQIDNRRDIQIAHDSAVESLPPHIRNVFKNYIIAHPDYPRGRDRNSYWMDLDGNKQTIEGTFSREMLKVIEKASKTNKVNIKALMTSLFILQGNGSMQPLPDGKVAVFNPGLSVTVYNNFAAPGQSQVDSAATRQLQEMMQQMLDVMRSYQNADERAQRITQIYQSNPFTAVTVMNGVGGHGFEERLQKTQGQAMADYYSEIVRGTLSAGASGVSSQLAQGNLPGAFGTGIGTVFAAILEEKVAAAAIRGLESGSGSDGHGNETSSRGDPNDYRLGDPYRYKNDEGNVMERDPSGLWRNLGPEK